jgi:dTDP-glucose 4,6-dehydratase
MVFNKTNIKNFLITGGAGFIGSCMVRKLIQDTNHRVLNVDKLTYASNLKSLSAIENNKRYFFEREDICNHEKMLKILKKFKPNIIINFAAESHVDRSIESAAEFMKTNIMGTFNLLQVSRKFFNDLGNKEKKNFKFHHVSTDEVYGDLGFNNESFTEETRYDPSSPYSASKASSDHLVRSWQKTFGLPTIITNCSNNYGPYHHPEKLIPHMILNALCGNKLPIYGDGKQVRDWLYVEDHVSALLNVAENGIAGETYNIGGNNQISNLDVVKTICKILEKNIVKPQGVKKFEDLIYFVKDRPGHDKRYAIDASKIKRELNWEPKETFKSGLNKTIMWYLNNRLWWKEILKKSYKLDRIGLDHQK